MSTINVLIHIILPSLYIITKKHIIVNYKPFSNFIFRTPTLPFKELFLDGLEKNTVIQEAVYLASPILYTELQKIENGDMKSEIEKKRILLSLIRYISRMSTRCTPFGLFAGCGTGVIGEETNITLQETIRRTTRLDMYYLCTLYDSLIRKEELKNKIKYYPNSSLYAIGKKIRYVETKYTTNRRKYQIAEVKKTSYLNFIINKAKNGRSTQELVDLLVNDYITINDATDYIYELIDAQILVAELSNSVTGDDFLSRVIKMLERINYSGQELPLLIQINTLLKELDDNASENTNTIYQKTVKLIKQIDVSFEEKYLFQVDLTRNTSSAVLGEAVVKELQKTLGFLNKITPVSRNETIKKFQEDFYNRYEDKEIPLMEALDPEIGIGYPSNCNNGDISPLVDDFDLPTQYNRSNSVVTAFTSLLMRKTIQCLSENKNEIIFCDEDVKDFNASWDDLPPTIYTMCEIINAKNNETLIKTSSFGGSCAANLLGRFAHTDQKMDIFIRDITKFEQQLMPDVILAEIVHLPEARIGNIQSRPHIRDYELLYLSDSDLPKEQLIYVSDLMLSVRHGKLIIQSKKLNKEIIPRLTTAHNYRNNTMPIYHFLCDMQHPNGRGGLFFNWGQFENELDYRPRVRYNNTILSAASWTVKIKDIKYLFEIKDDANLIIETTKWRQTISLPPKVLMPDGDNELYVDCKNALSLKSLFSIIKQRQTVKFEEFLFETEKSPVTDGVGKYINECIIVFHKNE